MNTARLFISLPVDPGIVKRISKEFLNLDLRWEKIKPGEDFNIHLSMKFLGTTPIDRVPAIIEALEKVDTQIENLELEIDKPKIFNSKRPQTLVLGFKENKDIQKLFDNIEQVLFDANLVNKEIRRFTTHLTIARVKQSAEFSEFADFEKWKINKIFNVPNFELRESVLTKQGPEYTILQTFDL